MPYIQTFIFGITLAISIGPIAILILNRSMNCGLKNGVLSGLGAATADLTYALVCRAFLLSLFRTPTRKYPSGFSGCSGYF